MEIEYYKFDKKMIKISKRFANNSILHFLNPDYEQEKSNE